jgi:hypothetical protein
MDVLIERCAGLDAGRRRVPERFCLLDDANQNQIG